MTTKTFYETCEIDHGDVVTVVTVKIVSVIFVTVTFVARLFVTFCSKM